MLVLAVIVRMLKCALMGMPPGIAIDQEHALLFEQRQTRTHIDGRRGFPGAPFMVGAGNDPHGVRGRHLRHVRRLPCSHVSHPCAGELFSLSMIKADKGKYQRLWAPCTRPHTSWTGDGLPPQVCPCDSIVSPLGPRALGGVSDLLILYFTTSFSGVWTFQSTKEAFQRLVCPTRDGVWPIRSCSHPPKHSTKVWDTCTGRTAPPPHRRLRWSLTPDAHHLVRALALASTMALRLP
jgi:hypothetical protein